MTLRIFKRLLRVLLVTLGLLILLMLVPRTCSLLIPQSKPLGYYSIPATYLAVYTGLEKMSEKNPAVPSTVRATRDLKFKEISGKQLRLDIYRKDGINSPVPLLVFIHGGAWAHGNRSEYLGYALRFAERGYVTATITYRFVPADPYPACLQDVCDAVDFLLQHCDQFGIDPNRVALVGGSAGAHLAMMTAYGECGEGSGQENRVTRRLPVRALVEMYGPTDLTASYARNHSMVKRLLAGTYEESPGKFRDASPVKLVTGIAPPTLILHGTGDNLVPVEQAELLKHKLDSLGVPCRLIELPGWPHTMDLLYRVQDYSADRMEEFFGQYLR